MTEAQKVKMTLTPPVSDRDHASRFALCALLPALDWHLSELGWGRIGPSGDYVWLLGESAEETSPFVSSVVLENGP